MNTDINAMHFRMKELYNALRSNVPTHDMKKGRKLTRAITKLIEEIGQVAPTSDVYLDALFYQEHAYNSLFQTSKRKDVQKRIRQKAFEAAEFYVEAALKRGPTRAAGFACYNLGIDLVVDGEQMEKGMHYLRRSRDILKALSPEELPRSFDFFYHDWGIATAQVALGDKLGARTTLDESLAETGILSRYKHFATKRGLGKCLQLYADVQLSGPQTY